MYYDFVSIGSRTEEKCSEASDQTEGNPVLPLLGVNCVVGGLTIGRAEESVTESGDIVHSCTLEDGGDLEVYPSRNLVTFPGGEASCEYRESSDWDS